MHPKDPFTPAAIVFVPPRLELAADTPEQKRRLELAKWITDPQNPLTARVMVNRIWQHHFGDGIVATPSDFGANGARPTNQPLLDWLATEFVAQGWHPKAIHRLILVSATYPPSSAANPHATAVDVGS